MSMKSKIILDTSKKIEIIIAKLEELNHVCREKWIERDIKRLKENIDVFSEGYEKISVELKNDIHGLRDAAFHPRGIRDQIPTEIEPKEWQHMADELVSVLDAYIFNL